MRHSERGALALFYRVLLFWGYGIAAGNRSRSMACKSRLMALRPIGCINQIMVKKRHKSKTGGFVRV